MVTHILVRRLEGKTEMQRGRKCMAACGWMGGWERDFDISEHSSSCDLNPKKKRFSVCGGERVSFRLAVKLTYGFEAETALETGGNKMQIGVEKNQFGLAGTQAHPCLTNHRATSSK